MAIGDTETTIDIVALAIVAAVIAFIVYEIHSTLTDDSSGWIWGAAAGAAGVFFFL